MDSLNNEIKNRKSFKSYWILDIILIIGVFFIFIHYILSAPIGNRDRTIHISSNDSLIKISQDLKNNNIIKSPYIFKTLMYVLSKDRKVKYGDYLFKANSSVLSISLQIAKGRHDVSPIKVTLREGMTNDDMSKLIADKLPITRMDAFLSDPRCKQGYLFPDTYFFYPLTTTTEVLEEITANFKKKILVLDNDINSSGRKLSDIIVMASILEKEASGKSDSAIISGILWKRIKIGMPLQVDASPSTYKNANLPVDPISNPGILSINSAIHPEDSPYLYYLHDKNGVVHYATNYSQHKINIARYLK